MSQLSKAKLLLVEQFENLYFEDLSVIIRDHPYDVAPAFVIALDYDDNAILEVVNRNIVTLNELEALYEYARAIDPKTSES